ncbi:DUF4232 domain-containing protein [Actinacidiphila glaucinigra]|uniref:DUF4232 domain-containing protein n=1 Tax=Actinacidiphila glaucinigra TaxID=235986 RepID=UPI00366DDF2E
MERRLLMKVSTGARVVPVLVLAMAALAACGPETDKAGSSGSSPVATASDASSSRGDSSAASQGRAGGEEGSADGASRDRSGVQDTDSGSGRGGEPQRCASGSLRVSVENQESGAGTTHFELAFRNTGTAPCALTGFPGVSFRGRDGAEIGNSADRVETTRATTVTLIPNARAVADAQVLNGQAGLSDSDCRLKSVSFLGVFPPDSRDQIDVPWKASECSVRGAHGLKIGPVHPVR